MCSYSNLAERPAEMLDVAGFESRRAHNAVAHGCDPALVRQPTRVGTGRRL
jgi:hypothetical protein